MPASAAAKAFAGQLFSDFKANPLFREALPRYAFGSGYGSNFRQRGTAGGFTYTVSASESTAFQPNTFGVDSMRFKLVNPTAIPRNGEVLRDLDNGIDFKIESVTNVHNMDAVMDVIGSKHGDSGTN